MNRKFLILLPALMMALVSTAQVQRHTVLEEFSTAKCQYCPLGVEYIKAGLTERPDVIWIVHHAGFLTDDITVPASSALTYLYSGGTYAPAFMLDRTVPANPEIPGCPVMGIVDSAELVALVDEMNSKECYTTVELVGVNYDPSTRRLTGRVEGRIDGDFDPEWTRLSVYLVEENIVLPQASTSGMISNYVHKHAVHGALTASNGDELDFEADGSFVFTFDNILSDKNVAENTHLVALVHEYSRGNRAANRILNATAAGTNLLGNPVGLEQATPSVALRLYPNPAEDHVDIVSDTPLRGVAVRDIVGREVMRLDAAGVAFRLDTRGLPSGVYVVTVDTEQGAVTKKVVKR